MMNNESGRAPTDRTYRVLQRMMEAIVTLQWPPGMELREQALAREFGVSRAPIREALHVLAREHLIVLRPRRSPIVAPLSLVEAQELYEYIAHVQSYAARLSLPTVSTAHQQELLARVNRCAEALDSNRTYRMTELDLFISLTQACPNQVIRGALEAAWRRAGRYHLSLPVTTARSRTHSLLGKLHDAVARRDGVMGETTIERLLGHARMATIQLPVDDA